MKLTTNLQRCYDCPVKDCSLLRNCSREALDVLSDVKQHYRYEKDEPIIREGELNEGVYFVSNGVVKAQVAGSGGKPLILWLGSAGILFGHRHDESMTTHPYSVVAVENTGVCFVPASDYRMLNETYPDFRREILHVYLKELQQAEKRSLLMAQKTVRQKVADALLHIAQAYGYFSGGAGFRMHLERQDMADLAGTTKEQVSKVLFEFKEEGLVLFRAKQFDYLNISALQAIAQ